MKKLDMKKLNLALVFLLFLTGAARADLPASGGSTQDLAQSLENYKRASISRNLDHVMSFAYPGLFKMLSEQEMRQGIKEMYDKGTAPKIREMTFGETRGPTAYSKGHFVIVTTRIAMEMPRPGDASADVDAFVVKMLKEKLGKGVQVVIDEQNSLIKVDRKTEMIALNEEGQGWKIIEKDNLAWLIDNKALPEDLAATLATLLE